MRAIPNLIILLMDGDGQDAHPTRFRLIVINKVMSTLYQQPP